MNKKRIAVFLILILIFLESFPCRAVGAEVIKTGPELRIGLTSLYSGKEKLTIYNTALGYGYCVGNTYLQETVLYSDTGFTFTPSNGYLVSEKNTYASYEAAAEAAKQYTKKGVEAYPGSVYQCSWRVYFGARAKYAEAEELKNSISKVTDVSLEILGGNNYRVLLEGQFGKLLLDVDGRFAYPQFRPVTTYEKDVFCINMGKRAYRGRMEIGRYGKAGLTAVNVVGMTEYLYGVVPAEMPSTWHEEALKAQAVCSRSYALIKGGYGGASNAKKGWKLVDTVSSQVYKGYTAESLKANRAVDATAGELVCFENKVVPAYFFSTSGGSTESGKAVWGAAMPYLQSVPDFYEAGAERMIWQETMSFTDISKLLAGQGIKAGTVTDLVPTVHSGSGRISALVVKGSDHVTTLQGTTIRTLLNLYSTKFKIIRAGDIPDRVTVQGADKTSEKRISELYIASADGVEKASQELSQYIVQSKDNLTNFPRTAPTGAEDVLFAGMGYGHGVGLSQYGAKGMAEAGYSYKEIIEYYYTGAYVK